MIELTNDDSLSISFFRSQPRRCFHRAAKPIVAILIGCFFLFSMDGAAMAGEASQGSGKDRPLPKLKLTPPLFKEWNFDKDTLNAPPTEFSGIFLNGMAQAPWVVKMDRSAPSRPHVLVQTTGCADSTCYRLLLAEGFMAEYIDLSVGMKVVLGASSGKGGLAFGAKDNRNFYAVVVSPETNIVEVFLVQDGKPLSLGQASLHPQPRAWHFLRVRRSTIISKKTIEVSLDNRLILAVSESTLTSGNIGLVTFGEGQFAFDNLRAVELLTSRPLSRPPAY